MDLSETQPTTSTDCRCAACGHRPAEFADPQITRRHLSTPAPELCAPCHARILEAQASRIALELHAVLSELDAARHGPPSDMAAVLQSIETWLELPPTARTEPDNVIIGRF